MTCARWRDRRAFFIWHDRPRRQGRKVARGGWAGFYIDPGSASRLISAPSSFLSVAPRLPDKTPGEVTEWSNVHDWKSCVRETVPRVRIPPSPPFFANRRCAKTASPKLAERRRARPAERFDRASRKGCFAPHVDTGASTALSNARGLFSAHGRSPGAGSPGGSHQRFPRRNFPENRLARPTRHASLVPLCL